MLTVHHLGVSQSDRIVWLCEELNISYELVRYERDPVSRLAPPEYRALHPFGTAPVITDGPLVLGESGAIIEYIISRYGSGRLSIGPDQANFADYLYWFHFANGSFMPSAMIDLVLQLTATEDTDTTRALRARCDNAYNLVEQRLGATDYFAGSEFTAADIIMLFPLTTMRLFAPRDISSCSNIRAYLQQIAARPAYQRAMNKADPDLTPVLT